MLLSRLMKTFYLNLNVLSGELTLKKTLLLLIAKRLMITAKTFSISIGGAFEQLLELEDYEIDEFYSKFKEATNKTTENVVGFKRNNLVEKLQKNIEVLCEERSRQDYKL